jgi:hypothetical protein
LGEGGAFGLEEVTLISLDNCRFEFFPNVDGFGSLEAMSASSVRVNVLSVGEEFHFA